MFRGIVACSVDAKGRLTVPSSHRKLLIEEADGKLVLTIDPGERCLLLYPLPRWLVIEGELERLPSFQPATRRIQRLLIGHATELELDRQGRILLSNVLREYAGLERSVMLVGQGKRMEIWGESQWQTGREAWLAEGTDEEGGGAGSLPELRSLSL